MCMRKILLGLALMLPVLLGNAQVLVDVKVDSLQLFIGEQTNLTLSVTLGAKQKVQLPTLKKGDQIIPLIEVLNVQRPDTNYMDEGKRMEIIQRYTITAWDSSLYYLPPFEVTVDGKKCFNERPTSTQQTAWTFVSQMRSWLPRQMGGCFWFGNDDGNMVAYTPIYCSMTRLPECYNTPGADAVTFSDKNAYWVENWVSNMVYPRYSMLFPTLREVRGSLQQAYFAQQPQVEEKVRSMRIEEMQRYLNDYSVAQAQQMLARWRQLAFHLVVKYNDMTIKPEENGQFLRNAEGLGATVKRPGFPAPYARRLIQQTGDRYLVPAE